MATDQVNMEPASSGNVLRDYYESGGLQRNIHLSSVHTATAIMNNASGELVLQRGEKEVMRTDIMDINSLVGATPVLRFVELVDSFAT